MIRLSVLTLLLVMLVLTGCEQRRSARESAVREQWAAVKSQPLCPIVAHGRRPIYRCDFPEAICFESYDGFSCVRR